MNCEDCQKIIQECDCKVTDNKKYPSKNQETPLVREFWISKEETEKHHDGINILEMMPDDSNKPNFVHAIEYRAIDGQFKKGYLEGLDENKFERDNLIKEVGQLRGAYEALEETLRVTSTNWANQRIRSQKTIDDFSNNNTELRSHLDEVNAELKQETKLYKDALECISKMEDYNKALEAELEKQQTQYEKQIDDITDQRDEYKTQAYIDAERADKAEKEILSLKAELNNTILKDDKKIYELKNQISDLVVELEQYKDKLVSNGMEWEHEIGELKDKNSLLSGELEQWKHKHAALNFAYTDKLFGISAFNKLSAHADRQTKLLDQLAAALRGIRLGSDSQRAAKIAREALVDYEKIKNET